MNKKIAILVAMSGILGVTIGYTTAVVSVPNTFVAGNTIKASEVNANFSALASEIASLKNVNTSNRSSNYSESVVTPIAGTLNSTINMSGENYTITQATGIVDPITGTTYSLTYPATSVGGLGPIVARFSTANCELVSHENIFGGDALLVRKVTSSSANTSYVRMFVRSPVLSGNVTAGVVISVQVSNSICADILTDGSTTPINASTAAEMTDRAVNLVKYIAVQGA